MSLHLKRVLSIAYHLILASFVVYREWVNLVIVSAWHLVLRTSLLYRKQYIVVYLSSDKSLMMKVSAICPECKPSP